MQITYRLESGLKRRIEVTGVIEYRPPQDLVTEFQLGFLVLFGPEGSCGEIEFFKAEEGGMLAIWDRRVCRMRRVGFIGSKDLCKLVAHWARPMKVNSMSELAIVQANKGR